MSEQYPMSEEQAGDAKADAYAATAALVVVVTTVCFWLLGQ
jgi:hypothetical protein